jgi:dihydrofolate synthase / folylpolyglutamate synthase
MRARRPSLDSFPSAVRWLDSLQGSGIRPGLDRMRRLLKAIGNPQRAFPTVIVAGTNGKGSTAATLASILDVAGYRVGLYTSPHLVSLLERWRLNRRDATELEVLEAAREVLRASEGSGVVPTYFEALTVLAFALFRRAAREIVVLEVGLGGRLDATNVTRPLVALVSSISIDHREFLGNTIPSVAREKAGVIHRGARAVTSVRDRDALDVLARRARDVGADLSIVRDECRFERARAGDRGLSFTLHTQRGSYRLKSPLVGRYQLDNVSLAVRGAEELARHFDRIDAASIIEGVAETAWRGRLERFVVGDAWIWVDGGHNEGAAVELAAWMRKSRRPPRTLVFGMMKDKDVEAAAAQLFPGFGHVIVTLADPERGCDPAWLGELARRHGVPVSTRRRPGDAVREALRRGEDTLVCGSLYVAGRAIPILDRAAAGRSKPAVPLSRAASDTMRPRRAKP